MRCGAEPIGRQHWASQPPPKVRRLRSENRSENHRVFLAADPCGAERDPGGSPAAGNPPAGLACRRGSCDGPFRGTFSSCSAGLVPDQATIAWSTLLGQAVVRRISPLPVRSRWRLASGLETIREAGTSIPTPRRSATAARPPKNGGLPGSCRWPEASSPIARAGISAQRHRFVLA